MNRDTEAVDLDGTLAHWDESEEYDPSKIGKAVPEMLDRVKGWLKDGKKVSIFTARVGESGAYPHIKKWLRDNGLPDDMEVTNIKRPHFARFHDDRAVAIQRNTGKVLGGDDGTESWEDAARKEMK